MNNLQSILKKEYTNSQLERMRRALLSFSVTERIIFSVFAAVFIFSSLYLLSRVNRHFSVQVPIQGGSLVEGVIGYPRYINPLLAVTDSDRDLTLLAYSGLMRPTAEGTLVPDLAESYTVSSDGLTYTFILKKGLYFQDGKPVTADDVVFTIEKAQDPSIKSPRRSSWDGVRVQKVDDLTVTFTLAKPYAPFLENTTLGILPKHIWNDAGPEQFAYSKYNVEPVGAGPYKFYKVKSNASGVPEYYDLVPFNKFSLGEPFIAHLIVKIFPNEKAMVDAYRQGSIESMYDISPEQAALISETNSTAVHTSPLPRVFAVFFNQNQAPVLANKEVRQALSVATDKQAIIDKVLDGYGVAINDPIPAGSIAGLQSTSTPFASTSIAAARKILSDNGWTPDANGIMQKKVKKDTISLEFSLSTSDATELAASAQLLKDMWQQIGAKVDVKIFETGDLNQSVIRPRKYDALLFGEIVGRDLDLYAFWHSSQRTDPGLNIAEYVNIKADKILENARTTTDMQERITDYQQFETEVRNDIPAIFLYSPEFIYVLPNKLQGVTIGTVTTPAERFSDINKWYVDTDNVWKIFVKQPTESNK